MTEQTYPLTAVADDYARAIGGFAACAGLLALAQPAPVGVWLLGSGAVLFGGFGLATLHRHLSPLDWDATRIRRGGLWPVTLRWDALTEMALRFFSTRRDRRRGWMELVLKGPGGRIVVGDGLPGFAALVGLAAGIAQALGLALSPATLANLDALAPKPGAAP